MINTITNGWAGIRKSGKSRTVIDYTIMITYCMTGAYIIVTSILCKRCCCLKTK